MKDVVLTPEKELLVARLSNFLANRDEIVFAYVYGSFLRQKTFSDIDIGVFLRKPFLYDPLNFELELESALQSLARFPVDLRVINFAPPSFVYNIIKESILIVDKEPNMRADFEGITCKKYFDFAAYRKRYLKEVTHAPL